MLIAIMTHILAHLITIQRRLIFYALAMVLMKFAIGISTRFHVSGFSREVRHELGFSQELDIYWLQQMRMLFPSLMLRLTNKYIHSRVIPSWSVIFHGMKLEIIWHP